MCVEVCVCTCEYILWGDGIELMSKGQGGDPEGGIRAGRDPLGGGGQDPSPNPAD